jgi:hypothetical protein
MEEWKYKSLFLILTLEEVNGQLHAPAALPLGNHPAWLVPTAILTLWKLEKSLYPCLESNLRPSVFQPIAQLL